jgi:hypothetical protein
MPMLQQHTIVPQATQCLTPLPNVHACYCLQDFKSTLLGGLTEQQLMPVLQ